MYFDVRWSYLLRFIYFPSYINNMMKQIMENTKFCICNDPRSENYKIIRKPNNLIIIGNLSFQLLQYVSKSVFVSICVFLHLEFYIFEFVTPLGHKNRKFHRLTIITKIDRHMVTLFDHLDICVPVYSFHPFSTVDFTQE